VSARTFMLAGSSVRLAYGIGSLVAPDWMSGRLAPDVRGHADGRMSLRGFGGLYIAVALLTMFGSYRTDIARPALALNLGCEAFDATAGLLELRDRGGPDPIALGGVAMPLAGALTWTAALRRL